MHQCHGDARARHTKRVIAELNRIADRGYAVDDREWEDGLRSVAAHLLGSSIRAHADRLA